VSSSSFSRFDPDPYLSGLRYTLQWRSLTGNIQPMAFSGPLCDNKALAACSDFLIDDMPMSSRLEQWKQSCFDSARQHFSGVWGDCLLRLSIVVIVLRISAFHQPLTPGFTPLLVTFHH